MRLIDADRLEERLEKLSHKASDYKTSAILSNCAVLVNRAPTIEAEMKSDHSRLLAVNIYSGRVTSVLIKDVDGSQNLFEPVKHGHWEHLGGDEWLCSCCGNLIFTEGSWEKPTDKRCSECGAKMDEVSE